MRIDSVPIESREKKQLLDSSIPPDPICLEQLKEELIKKLEDKLTKHFNDNGFSEGDRLRAFDLFITDRKKDRVKANIEWYRSMVARKIKLQRRMKRADNLENATLIYKESSFTSIPFSL